MKTESQRLLRSALAFDNGEVKLAAWDDVMLEMRHRSHGRVRSEPIRPTCA